LTGAYEKEATGKLTCPGQRLPQQKLRPFLRMGRRLRLLKRASPSAGSTPEFGARGWIDSRA
jgi:hypothetical protein